MARAVACGVGPGTLVLWVSHSADMHPGKQTDAPNVWRQWRAKRVHCTPGLGGASECPREVDPFNVGSGGVDRNGAAFSPEDSDWEGASLGQERPQLVAECPVGNDIVEAGPGRYSIDKPTARRGARVG